MTIACITIPHFSLRVEVLNQPELDGLPLAQRSPEDKRPTIIDCTPEARKQGIKPGMLPREALATCPDIVIVSPNPARDNSVFEQIVQQLGEISPGVEPEDMQRCYVDLRGLGRHYRGPEQIAQRLLSAVPKILRPRVGIAPDRFTARVAAGKARPGNWLIVNSADVRAFLAVQPVHVLPIAYDTINRLDQLGIRTLQDLTELPLSAVQARFGPEGRNAWTLATGGDHHTVQPRQYTEAVIESITLPAPSASRETFMIALQQAAIRAFNNPALQGRNVRQVHIRAFLDGGGSWEQTITLKEPAHRERLIEALKHRLQSVELPGALETVELEMIGLGAEQARQETLLNTRPRRLRSLIDAVRQLKQRYGTSPIYYIVEVEPWSRIPERRRALISFDP